MGVGEGAQLEGGFVVIVGNDVVVLDGGIVDLGYVDQVVDCEGEKC